MQKLFQMKLFYVVYVFGWRHYAAPAAEAGTTRKTCPGHKWFLVLTKLLLWFNLRLLWLLASWGWSCCISTTNGLDWAVLYSGPPEQEVRVCVQACRPWAPPDFGRSVNPISTKGGRSCPPNNTGIDGFSDLLTALSVWRKAAISSDTRTQGRFQAYCKGCDIFSAIVPIFLSNKIKTNLKIFSNLLKKTLTDWRLCAFQLCKQNIQMESSARKDPI